MIASSFAEGLNYSEIVKEGNLVYLSSFDGAVSVFDISAPFIPVVKTIESDDSGFGSMSGIDVQNGLVYGSVRPDTSAHGLIVLDLLPSPVVINHRLGVNTVNPTSELDVAGTTTAAAVIINSDTTPINLLTTLEALEARIAILEAM